MLQCGIMHLSPLSSSKKIDSARSRSGLFFCPSPSHSAGSRCRRPFQRFRRDPRKTARGIRAWSRM